MIGTENRKLNLKEGHCYRAKVLFEEGLQYNGRVQYMGIKDSLEEGWPFIKFKFVNVDGTSTWIKKVKHPSMSVLPKEGFYQIVLFTNELENVKFDGGKLKIFAKDFGVLSQKQDRMYTKKLLNLKIKWDFLNQGILTA